MVGRCWMTNCGEWIPIYMVVGALLDDKLCGTKICFGWQIVEKMNTRIHGGGGCVGWQIVRNKDLLWMTNCGENEYPYTWWWGLCWMTNCAKQRFALDDKLWRKWIPIYMVVGLYWMTNYNLHSLQCSIYYKGKNRVWSGGGGRLG
jgi:hypothetical protein